MAIRVRLLTVVVAILGLLASPLVACASEAMASEAEQMGCCQAGQHDCGTAMKPADCCTHSDARTRQLNASKVERLQKHIIPVLPIAHPAGSGLLEEAFHARPGGALEPSVDTGPPDCIAFSVLLI